MSELDQKEENYIAIKDFIVIVNRTEQSIYKRLKNEKDKLNQYSKKFSHGIKIHKTAIKEIYGLDYTDEQVFGLVDSVEHVEKVDSTTAEKQENNGNIHETDKKIIDILEREIEKKDKIIADLTLQLADTTQMLSQQQQLSLADKQTIKLLQESNKKRRGIIGLLFGGKEKEQN